MTIHEIISSGLLELYVTGVTSTEETTQVEIWAKDYPEVKQEIDELQRAMEEYSFSQAIEPDESIKKKLLSRIQSSTQPNDAVASFFKKDAAPVYKLPSYFKWAVAAGIILLLGSLVMSYIFYNKYQSSSDNFFAINKKYDSVFVVHQSDSAALFAAQQNIDELKKSANNKQQIFQKEKNELAINKEHPKDNTQQVQQQQSTGPDINTYANVAADKYSVPVLLKGTKSSPDALAKIFWMKNSGEVYVDAKYLPAPPYGKQYQLWAIVQGVPVDAGMITTPIGNYKIQKMKSFGSAEAFAITMENTGGSPTPTMKAMVVKAKI